MCGIAAPLYGFNHNSYFYFTCKYGVSAFTYIVDQVSGIIVADCIVVDNMSTTEALGGSPLYMVFVNYLGLMTAYHYGYTPDSLNYLFTFQSHLNNVVIGATLSDHMPLLLEAFRK